MKTIQVVIASLLSASLLLASDISSELVELSTFVAGYLDFKQGFEDIGEEKVSEEQAENIKTERHHFLIKHIKDYIDRTAEPVNDPTALLDKWFGQVKGIRGFANFSKKDAFTTLWNQVLRDQLDMSISGTALIGYIDKLKDPLFNELEIETRSFLAEWEDEKKLGESKYSPSIIEEDIDLDRFELVFQKPVNVRGSHAKYLCREIGSGLVFKIVTVKPHGARKSAPKDRRQRAILQKLSGNFERKTEYQAAVEAVHSNAVKTEPTKSIQKTLAIDSEIKSKLRNLHIDGTTKPQTTTFNAKDIAPGKEYYDLLSSDAKKVIDSGYKAFYKNNKTLVENRANGKYIYSFHVINEQNKIDIEAASNKKTTKVSVHYTQTTNANKENLHDANNPEALEKQKADMELQRKENAEKLLQLLNDQRGKNRNTIIEFIKQNNIDINQADADSNTAILLAIKRNDFLIIEAIVNKFKIDIDLNIQDNAGATPLMLASWLGNFKIVKYLVDKNADIYIKDNYGRTALTMASQGGHDSIVELLAKKAQQSGNIDYINTQLNEKSHANFKGFSPLMLAAYYGFPEVVEILLRYGAHTEITNDFKHTALYLAVMAGGKDVVQILAPKANVNAQDISGKSMLVYALNNLDILEILLANRADPNLKDANNISAFDYLCSDNFDFELKNSSILILSNLIPKEVKLKKIKLFRERPFIYEPLQEIILNGYIDEKAASSFDSLMSRYLNLKNQVLAILLKNGANASDKMYNNKTPLEQFSLSGNDEAVKLLLKHGVRDRGEGDTNALSLAESGLLTIKRAYDTYKATANSPANLERIKGNPIQYDEKITLKRYLINILKYNKTTHHLSQK